jgi:hypothetical protein
MQDCLHFIVVHVVMRNFIICTHWESPRERDHLEDQGVGGKMGSEWILGTLAWGVWIGFDWPGQGP